MDSRTAPTPARSGEKPLAFAYDARKKSIVPGVLQLEEKRRKRLFARKPKVGLAEFDEALKRSVAEAELSALLRQFSRFYYGHDQAELYFESLGRLLVEAASKEREQASRQRLLLFSAIDCLSTAIQKSPRALNVGAQSIVVSIYKILGPSHRDVWLCEREVHREMMAMISIKKDAGDFTSRERIIKLYVQAQRYYEALVQMAEYERIMRTKSRPLYLQKQGDLAFRKASIFQAIIDFYSKVRAGDETERGKVANLGKLNAFITRFNRDNHRVQIVPLKNMNALGLQHTLHSLVSIANSFYEEASQARQFQAKHRPLFMMARNNCVFESPKVALKNLAHALHEIDNSRIAPRQRIPEKLKILEFEYRLYLEIGQKSRADEVNNEMSRLRRESSGEDKPEGATEKPGAEKSATQAPAPPAAKPGPAQQAPSR
ncbi:MAG: hypothetical protein HY423_02570 [Candidatus Lambdaproteobacteria bacterium]|nr:hypothetical protein [Candidatus Lambdaproteobacteria bacterium]